MENSSLIFKDPDIHSNLLNKGYTTIKALNPEDISTLIALYTSTKTDTKSEDAHLYVSSRECNVDTSLRISDTIKQLLTPFFDSITDNYALYGGAFLSKPKLEKNEFSLHQDFTLIDREKDTMYAIWIALQDTTISNGCMYLVDQSHNLFPNYISATYNNNRIRRKYISKEYISDIELKAGEGIIFIDGIFHGSYPNTSTQERLAITARISNKSAQFVYYNKHDENTCIQYAIQPNDLIQYFEDFRSGTMPKHLVEVKRFAYKHYPITEQSLQAVLRKRYPDQNTSILFRLQEYATLIYNKLFDSV